MKMSSLLIPLSLCLGASLMSMERPRGSLIRRTVSAEALHSVEYNKTQALKALAQQHHAPQARAFKPTAMLTPPAPQTEPSFIEKHKNALAWGLGTTGALISAAALWKFGSGTPKVRDYYNENAK